MFTVLSTLVIIFAVLLVNEYLWMSKRLKGEAARKFVHILIGVWGAFWPFYMDWEAIQIISLLSVIFFLSMRLAPWFQSLYDVKRKSFGDVIAPATIGLLTLVEPNKWIFAAAILHIALADGFAALSGSRFGNNNRYVIFGNTKSVVGSITFWAASFMIIAGALILSPISFTETAIPLLLWLPLAATLLENICPYGLDNLGVPLLIVAVLGSLQVV